MCVDFNPRARLRNDGGRSDCRQKRHFNQTLACFHFSMAGICAMMADKFLCCRPNPGEGAKAVTFMPPSLFVISLRLQPPESGRALLNARKSVKRRPSGRERSTGAKCAALPSSAGQRHALVRPGRDARNWRRKPLKSLDLRPEMAPRRRNRRKGNPTGLPPLRSSSRLCIAGAALARAQIATLGNGAASH